MLFIAKLGGCTGYFYHTMMDDDSRCESLKTQALASIYVKFMRDKMQELGCSTGNDQFSIVCEPCESEGIIGRFDAPNLKLILCSDNIQKFKLKRDLVERAVFHELIHAYDHCRVELDPGNCDHIACTEVRAAHLSGDCDLNQEINRRNFHFKAQGMACAKRRAQLNVQSHPHCAGEKGIEAVARVFDACYSDTAPFARKC
jgi:inner membrane protease ATP23